MKYLFFRLLFLTAFCFFSYGCKKTLSDPSGLDLINSIRVDKKLSSDSSFIALLVELHDYNMFLLNSINSGEFSKSDLDKHVSYLQGSGLTTPEQYGYLSGVFGNTFASRLKSHIENSHQYIVALKERYGEFRYESLVNAIDSTVSIRNSQVVHGDSSYFYSDDRACGFRYFLCMGAVYAGAIVCHAACTSTTLAVPVCVAACATMQIHYSLECQDNYCQPASAN